MGQKWIWKVVQFCFLLNPLFWLDNFWALETKIIWLGSIDDIFQCSELQYTVQHFEQNSKHKCSEKTENKNGLQYNQLSTTVTSPLANIKLSKAEIIMTQSDGSLIKLVND